MAKIAQPSNAEPFTPAMADEAPLRLTAFIYLLARDHVPFRRIEEIVALTRRQKSEITLPNEDLAAYAERIARQVLADE
jgi:hypothetical protein